MRNDVSTPKAINAYEPNFIAETTDVLLMVKFKRRGELDDEECIAKAKVAKLCANM